MVFNKYFSTTLANQPNIRVSLHLMVVTLKYYDTVMCTSVLMMWVFKVLIIYYFHDSNFPAKIMLCFLVSFVHAMFIME
jgi:hypothetical protein